MSLCSCSAALFWSILGSLLLLSAEGSDRLTVCEHDSISIECTKGSYIEINEYRANFGRTDAERCLRGPVLSAKCHTSDTAQKLKDRCQKQESCTILASKDIFGDPCPGTFKFLEFNYTCIEDSRENEAV